jgi:hypothetical protein
MKTLINEKPQIVFGKLLDEATSASVPQELRNRKQMYYVRRDRKRNLPETGTGLGHLMFKVKDKDFVHKFTCSGYSLHYAIDTKQQLYDLERFFTDSANFSVFSIDSTFDFGNVFVTNTCFENKGSNLYPYKAGNE